MLSWKWSQDSRCEDLREERTEGRTVKVKMRTQVGNSQVHNVGCYWTFQAI